MHQLEPARKKQKKNRVDLHAAGAPESAGKVHHRVDPSCKSASSMLGNSKGTSPPKLEDKFKNKSTLAESLSSFAAPEQSAEKRFADDAWTWLSSVNVNHRAEGKKRFVFMGGKHKNALLRSENRCLRSLVQEKGSSSVLGRDTFKHYDAVLMLIKDLTILWSLIWTK